MVITLYHDRFSSRCHLLDTGNNLIEIKKRSSGSFPGKYQDYFEEKFRLFFEKNFQKNSHNYLEIN
jgi:hypothetical protein